jgi:hypothetical protein
MNVTVEWSQHLASNNNQREHWKSRSRRMNEQRKAAKNALYFNRVREQLGETPPGHRIVVRLARLSTHPLDPGDNHNSSFKAVRDEISKYLGVNDRYEDQVRFDYAPHLFCERPTVRVVFSFEPHVAPVPTLKRSTIVSERPIESARDWQKRGLLSSNVVRNRR